MAKETKFFLPSPIYSKVGRSTATPNTVVGSSSVGSTLSSARKSMATSVLLATFAFLGVTGITIFGISVSVVKDYQLGYFPKEKLLLGPGVYFKISDTMRIIDVSVRQKLYVDTVRLSSKDGVDCEITDVDIYYNVTNANLYATKVMNSEINGGVSVEQVLVFMVKSIVSNNYTFDDLKSNHYLGNSVEMVYYGVKLVAVAYFSTNKITTIHYTLFPTITPNNATTTESTHDLKAEFLKSDESLPVGKLADGPSPVNFAREKRGYKRIHHQQRTNVAIAPTSTTKVSTTTVATTIETISFNDQSTTGTINGTINNTTEDPMMRGFAGEPQFRSKRTRRI